MYAYVLLFSNILLVRHFLLLDRISGSENAGKGGSRSSTSEKVCFKSRHEDIGKYSECLQFSILQAY